MRYGKTKGSETISAIFVLLWVALFIVLSATQIQHWDSDIFWALRSGRWIVENWQVPLTDPLSYTFSGGEWVDFTWGFQVIAHFFYTSLGGWTGLYILQLLLTFAVFAALLLNIRQLVERRLWLLPLLLVLTLACSYPRLFIRPHLFGFLFISTYLLILNSYERKKTSLLLFLILPLQVFWVNIHSSAILGVLIVWAYASGEFIDVFIRDGFKGFRALLSSRKNLIILALIIPLVSLLNPYGLKLAIFPFIHQGGVNSDALRHIGEWTRLPFKELFFYFFPVPVNYFAFRLLFYGTLVSLVLNWRKVKTRDIMLFGGAAYMAVSHVRWVGQFAFFGAPIIAFNMKSYLEGRGGEARWLARAGIILSLFIAILMGLLLTKGDFTGKLGIGLRVSDYPVGSVRFMRENALKGNIYNYYDFGGYLTFNYPELKVFIDGRTPTVYSPHFYWKERHAESKEGWKKLSSELAITMALVKLDQPLCKVLYKSEQWTPVVFDDVAALYLKKKSGYGDIIKGKGLSFTPCSGDKQYKIPKGQKERLEMEKGLRSVMNSIDDGGEGMHFYRPHRLLGLLLGEFKDKAHQREAVEELKTASEAPGSDSFVYYDLGIALGRVGRREEAIAAFKTSIKLNKAFKRSYLALGLTYFDNKNYEASARLLGKYVVLADDKAEFPGLKVLGRSCFKLGRLTCAEDALKRAAFIADSDKKEGEVFYYLGNTFFEAGDLDKGVEYYRRAISKDSSYEKVLENLSKMLASKKDLHKSSAITDMLKKVRKKD